GQFVKLHQQKRPRGFFRAGQNALVQPFKKVRVAGQKPAVQQRQMKFRVVLFNALAFFHGAPGGTHAKTQVPQRAREVRDQRPELVLRLVAAEKKKNIEVGIRKEQLARVGAEGQQAQSRSGRVVHAQHFAKDLADVVVGQRAQRAQRLPGARTRFKLFANTLSFVIGLRAEYG